MPRRDVNIGKLSARHATIPVVEALEQRQMLSATLKGAHLEVLGTHGDDVVVVNVKGPRLVVDVNGQRSVFPKQAVRRMSILTGRGDDRIKVAAKTKPIAIKLKAGPGENILLGRVAPVAHKPKPQPEPQPQIQDPVDVDEDPVEEPVDDDTSGQIDGEAGRQEEPASDGDQTLQPPVIENPIEEPAGQPLDEPQSVEEPQDEAGLGESEEQADDPLVEDETSEPQPPVAPPEPVEEEVDIEQPTPPDTTGGGLLGDSEHSGDQNTGGTGGSSSDGSGQPLSGDLDDFFAPLTIDAGADLVDGAVRGTGATLTARGGFWIDGPAMRYHWAVISKPAGALDPVFAGNGGPARDVAVTFSQAGQYSMQVVVVDGNNSMVGSAVLTILVAQVAASIQISPADAHILPNSSMQFTAEVRDQFGQAMADAAVTWSVEAGGIGSVDGSGLYGVGPAIGSAVVRAVAGAVAARANVTVSTTVPVKPVGDGGFKVFDATAFLNKPDLSEFGVETVYITSGEVYPGAWPNWDMSRPSEAAVRSLARKVSAMGQMLVLDIEHWYIDIRTTPESEVQKNLTMLIQIVDWAKDERPDLKLGFFAILPAEGFWVSRSGEGSEAYKAWQAANARLQVLADKVDFIAPALYTNREDREWWRINAEATIREAKRYGKPVYAFLWTDWNNRSSPLHNTPIPRDYWELELSICRQHADGVIIWGGWKVPPDGPVSRMEWEPQAPWWLATREFVTSLRDAAADGSP